MAGWRMKKQKSAHASEEIEVKIKSYRSLGISVIALSVNNIPI